MGEHTNKVYLVLAFGDSHTEGSYFAGFRLHPYTIRLGEKISNHCDWVYGGNSNRPKIEVQACGRSGECVLSGMIDRLKETLNNVQPDEPHYRWVIICGGVNDLALGIEPNEIFHGLRQMYNMVYEHGANLVVLTVTETGLVKTNDPRDSKRHQLNTLIKKYAWENHHAGGKRTFCVDIDHHIPWHRPDMDKNDCCGTTICI